MALSSQFGRGQLGRAQAGSADAGSAGGVGGSLSAAASAQASATAALSKQVVLAASAQTQATGAATLSSARSLTLNSTGLILREQFDAANGWTAGSGFSRLATPALVTFGRHPNPVIQPGSGGTYDADGVREPQIYCETDALWAMLYDAGNNTTGWRSFVATSTDRGVTWTKHGALGMALANGSGGNYAAVAMGWVEKRGSTYYLHRVTTNATFPSPDVGLPGSPYQGDTWTTTAAPGAGWAVPGNWTFSRAFGPGTGWAATELLPGSVYFDGTTYHMFVEGANSGPYKGGRQYSTSPDGPWTLDPTPNLDSTHFGGHFPENGKVFYHPTLGKYVELANLIEPVSGTFTDRNGLRMSSSLTDWSSADSYMTQRFLAPNVSDNQRALGVQVHLTGPDGALVHDQGYVPFVYDADPGASSPGWHRQRKIRSAVYEPAPNSLRYSDATATRNRYSKSLSHTDFEAEFSVNFASVGGGGDLSFEYRSNGTTGYRVRLPATYGANALLERMDGTLIDNGASGIVGMETSVMIAVRLRVATVGGNTTHTVWLDGSQNLSVVDNTYTSGTQIAFSGKTQTGDIRLFHMRTVGALTVRGVTAGATVTLRSFGGIYVEQATANGLGVATFTEAHYPVARIESSQAPGVDLLAPDGLLWGGDDVTYPGGVLAASAIASATSTAALSLSVPIAAVPAASSTATSSLVDAKPLAASAAAAATASAALAHSTPLAAAPAASATTSSALTIGSLPTLGYAVSDTSTGAWTPSTGTTLYGTIDEVVPDASDYISTTGLSTCEFALNNTAFPGTANQTLSYRASSSTGNGLTAVLKQGGTTIATWSHALSNTDTLYTQTLTAGQIAAVVAGPLSVSLTST